MPRSRNYERNSWQRLGEWDKTDLLLLHQTLSEETEGQSDEERPRFTVGQLREWLQKARPKEVEQGAELREIERDVTYRVTLDDTPGSTGLRTVEVETPPGATDSTVFRLPVSQLKAETAALLELQADSGADIVVGDREEPLTTERLAELVRKGIPRRDIAAQFGRSESRIDQLIREGRRARPDLNWPPARRGPRAAKAQGGEGTT